MRKILICTLMLTAACVPARNASMSIIQDKSGNKIGSANVSVVSKYDEGTTMTVTTDEGEVFKGEVIKDAVESEYADDMLNITGYSGRYYSRGYAMLISDKNSMECSLRLTRPRQSIAWGGGGECKISDGRKLPFTLSGSNRR